MSDLNLVYNELKKVNNIDIYKFDQIPNELNYGKSSRNGHLLLVAHIGFTIYLNQNQSLNNSKLCL